MKMHGIKKTIIGLLIALIAAAVLLCPVYGGIAFGGYGDKNAEELWYYQEGALNLFGAKAVVDTWDKSKLSPVIIAVADTGIDVAHELFEGVLYQENGEAVGYSTQTKSAAKGTELADNVTVGTNNDKHGNSVAGIIAMEIKELGLQDYIKIYPIKANDLISGGKNENTFSIASIVEAINRAHEIGAEVLNLSLGIHVKDMSFTVDWKTDPDLLYAIEAVREEMLIVAAAGNGDSDGNDSANDTKRFYPAANDSILGVMSYGKDGDLMKNSNYGSYYELAAPGQEIYTAYGAIGNTYHNISGTSAAAPSASLAAALLKLRFQAEGKEKPNGSNTFRMMKNLSGRKTAKGNYSIKCLDFYTVVTQDFENSISYSAPAKIEISHNGGHGNGYYYDYISMRANRVNTITFIAKINPYGEVSPDLYDSIEWVLRKGDLGIDGDEETEGGDDVEEEVIGRGGKFDYTAKIYGDTKIYARLNYGSAVLKSKEQGIHIEYLEYYVGSVRVTFAENAHESVKDAPSSGVLYSTEVTTFSLTGIDYVDQSVPITWFVNGKEAGQGVTFDFKPSKAGKYIITAKYGDRKEISNDFVFTAEVKPFILRPLDLSMLIIGLAVAIAAIAVAVVILVKRKRLAATSDKEMK